jgi:hypothetical protein
MQTAKEQAVLRKAADLISHELGLRWRLESARLGAEYRWTEGARVVMLTVYGGHFMVEDQGVSSHLFDDDSMAESPGAAEHAAVEVARLFRAKRLSSADLSE